MSKYLLEIGVEELPYKFITSAIEQLKTGFEALLNNNEISYGKVEVYGAPRRLAIEISDLTDKQKDVIKTVKGPIAKIAYTQNGELSPAGLGFAKKNGVEPKDIYTEDNYIFAKVEQKGALTKDVLSDAIQNLILKLQAPYFMRWADLDVKFQRPIRWILSLYNDEILPLEIAKVKASNFTRGHRFANENMLTNIVVDKIDNYKKILFDNKVIVDQKERREKIIELCKKEADKIGASIDFNNEALLEEVTNIVEYPIPVVCEFDEKYLSVPDVVTVTIMETHQRYFPLYKDGKLLNKFITVTNYLGDNFDNIRNGNLRVVRARLEDGIFFYEEDTKTKLSDKLEALKGVTFQKGMGSMYEKTKRIVELSKYLQEELDVKSETIDRTALLCKADLVTKLVFEFTELQGFIGADYALKSGENERVAQGIKEHYFPLGANSVLSSCIEGQIVGIADKIDTICAVFAGGKKPTGSSDPLGVRRATFGIIATIEDKKLDINLDKLVEKSISILPVEVDDKTKLKNNVLEFFKERLYQKYKTQNVEEDVLQAVLNTDWALSDLKDFSLKLEIAKELKFDKYQKFVEQAKRVYNILKDYNEIKTPDETKFVMNEEKNLYLKIKNVNNSLTELDALTPDIIEFFDKVLVMEEGYKENRLALLYQLKLKLNNICNFSKIVQ
ncbi:glycine--tRNA ligase subunit beta [bacterium]|nr:glycine--tRNA ligase subunit beta [bacterium]